MTVHNLSKCLAWLLQQSESFPTPSLDHLNVTLSACHELDEYYPPFCDAQAASSQQAMARLQLAPQSVKKTRLLTQQKPLPMPSATNSPRSSSPIPQPVASKIHRTPVRATVAAPTKTPMINYDDSVFDIDDLEDLLSDEGHDITISSYGDFGTPQRLWTENAASRVEPLAVKKGKKRKSEEYCEDIRYSSPRTKTRPTYERDIYEISQKNYRGRNLCKDGNSSQDRWDDKRVALETKEDASSDPDLPQHCHGFSEDLTRFERGKPSQTLNCLNQATILDRPNPHHMHASQNTVIAASPDRPGSLCTSGQRSTRLVVPDSNDEDEKIEKDAQVRSTSSHCRTQRSSLQSSVSKSPAKVEQSPPSQDAMDKLAASTQRSLKRTVERLKQSDVMTPTHISSQIVISPASSNEQLAKEQQELLAQFMSNADRNCKSLLEHFEAQKKEAGAKMVEDVFENKISSEDLIQALQNIKSQINAINEIKNTQDEYVRTCNDIQLAKALLRRLIMEDQDLTEALKDLQGIKTNANTMGARLYLLIKQSGWTNDMLLLPPSDTDTHGSGLVENVLVTSTQQRSASVVGSAIRHDRNVDGWPISHYNSACSIERDPAHFTADSKWHTPAESVPNENLYAINHKAKNTNSGERYSRTMGSPSRPIAVVDEFDAMFDEDDMIDAALEYENASGPGKALNASPRTSRTALSSVSGNAPRGPLRGSDVLPQPPATQFPWTKDVNMALRKRFHLQGFRHNQLEAINATLGGKDAFVLMPTGGGKSLCYQLPSVVRTGKTHGVTIVVSPLLSLMQDQVDHLQKLRIEAFLINGESTQEHKKSIFEAMKGPQPEKLLQLLYITPEMVGKSQAAIENLAALHKRKKLARIVIDEAHCVSQWGHDFRPDYKALGEFRQQFPGVPVMALTATATENVKVDVIHNLNMTGCEVFNQSFNRPNLSYEVREKSKGQVLDDIANIINVHHRGQSGIVYCYSRKDCESVSCQLQKDHAIKASHYHAGMTSADRITVQKQWQAGEYDVIVATIAFGMGIDKPDVRFVIHQTIPKSLEGYYQETGRAGRDGLPSQCYLFYSFGDTTRLRKMIKSNKDSNWQQKERQLQMLRNVVMFCENRSDCRRYQVLNYFNEHFDRKQCHSTCDNCKSDSIFETVDLTAHAKEVISLVRQIEGGKVTLLHCVDVYRGATSSKITKCGHKDLDEYGRGSNLERGDLERLLHRLVSEEVLKEHNVVNRAGFATQYIKLGKAARAFESKGKVEIEIRASPHGKIKHKATGKGIKKPGRGTGMKAAQDHPTSTNVSSPVEMRKSKAKLKPQHRLPIFEEESEEEDNDEDDDDDDDVFETQDLAQFAPIRQRGIPSRGEQQQLGPAITTDSTLSKLDIAQRNVLDDFTSEAKHYIQEQVMKKGLKQNPIPDSVLRDIGIALPSSLLELAQISGMSTVKVQTYGPRILQLVQAARDTYIAITQAANESSETPVISITTDEEDFFSTDDFDIDEVEASESSRYFSGQVDLSSGRNTSANQMRTTSTAPKTKGVNRAGSQGKPCGVKKTQGSRAAGRRPSGGKAPGQPKPPRKNRSSGSGTIGNSKQGNTSASKSKGSATASNRGGSLIGMMPT